MAEKENLCKALDLLLRVVDVMGATLTENATIMTPTGPVFDPAYTKAEKMAKPLVTELFNHFRSSTASKPANFEEGMTEANKKLTGAKYGDGKWFGVVDAIRDAIHQNQAIRRYFLGGGQVDKEVYDAMHMFGESDDPIPEMTQALQAIRKQVTCTGG